MTWQNRILEHTEEAPDQLLANPKNWRTHPGTQAAALVGVLDSVGYVQSVIVNRRTGHLVDGHLRVMEALKRGQPTIPVAWVDLSEEDEALILATLDPLAAMAGTDAAALESLLHDVSSDSADTMALLDQIATDAGIVPGIEEGDGGDDFDTTPDDGPTRCSVGDLWVIGGVHRLLVGDCTDAANVARLMGGERAGAIFTSPPYDQQRTYNGSMAADWRALVSGSLLLAAQHCEDDAQVFINLGLIHRDGRVVRYWDLLIDDLENADWPLFGWYVWDQGSGLPGDWNGRFAPSHEWIFHFSNVAVRPAKIIPKKENSGPMGSNLRSKDGKNAAPSSICIDPNKIPDSVVRVNRNSAHGTGHPATFPVTLPERFMDAYNVHIWYEPFCGAGSSLIAAHRTGRRCYGMEIEPRYGDVILRRAEAEGLTCELLTSEEFTHNGKA